MLPDASSAVAKEIKAKIYKKSHLKLLLETFPTPFETDFEDLYLSAPEFPLRPQGGSLKFLKKPHALPDKSYYIGEAQDSTLCGLGFQLSPKGWYYEGYYKAGVFCGKGRLFTASGNIISGTWCDGEISSGNIFTPPNKTYAGDIVALEASGRGQEECEDYSYKGEYFKGKKHGQGRLEWRDGNWYEGEFIMGRIEGNGKHHWEDSEYEGSWKANKMHGLGIQEWVDGSRYEGSMKLGFKDGYGVYSTPVKKYSGYWKNGKEDGKGVLEEDGKVSEGLWKAGKMISTDVQSVGAPSSPTSLNAASCVRVRLKDIWVPEKVREKCRELLEIREKMEPFEFDENDVIRVSEDKWRQVGKGVFYGETNAWGQPHGRGIWLNSVSLYEGWFTSGERTGFGRQLNKHGELYIGDLDKGLKCGFGSLSKPDAEYVGDWDENKFHGRGRLATAQLTYDGDWVQGLQHGKGTLEYADGKVYAGDFKAGVVEGYGFIKYPSGLTIHGSWEAGQVTKVLKKTHEEAQNAEDSTLDQETRLLLQSLLN
jgi:hypothetical protein